jgi:hypothetical protein
MAAPKLEYTSLGEHQIRILYLLPGQWEDMIECMLMVVSSKNNPKYEALSYTWGDSTITEPITVNGAEFQVTTNLAAALRYLRQSDTINMLWVDALCINQLDDIEKSEQVAVMGDTYRKCSQVQIWLGCPVIPTDQEHDPFALLLHYSLDGHLWELPGFHGSVDQGIVFFENHPEFEKIWSGFLRIANSTWWQRMWVVQEAGEFKKDMLNLHRYPPDTHVHISPSQPRYS